jgi:hypothetical protein
LRLLLTLGALAGIACIALVLWFLWLLATSPSEPDGFGQDHQEQWAVASCWREIRDGNIRSTAQCSEYAQAHLDLFTAELTANPAITTCNLSRSHLAYARKASRGAKLLLAQLQKEVRADCSHPDVPQ